ICPMCIKDCDKDCPSGTKCMFAGPCVCTAPQICVPVKGVLPTTTTTTTRIGSGVTNVIDSPIPFEK
ncbi:hypothetical protein HK098_007382, partial [Nowakowskiella sp. JEL0407]